MILKIEYNVGSYPWSQTTMDNAKDRFLEMFAPRTFEVSHSIERALRRMRSMSLFAGSDRGHISDIRHEVWNGHPQESRRDRGRR